MTGTPALFIDGKFIGCPRPQSKNCSFSQRLKSGHPPGDQAPGLRFFAIFGAKTSLLPSRIARNRPISETGSLLTLPSSAESATNQSPGVWRRSRDPPLRGMLRLCPASGLQERLRGSSGFAKHTETKWSCWSHACPPCLVTPVPRSETHIAGVRSSRFLRLNRVRGSHAKCYEKWRARPK